MVDFLIGTWPKIENGINTEKNSTAHIKLENTLVETETTEKKTTTQTLAHNKSNLRAERERRISTLNVFCYYWQQHLLHIENEWSKAVERLFFIPLVSRSFVCVCVAGFHFGFFVTRLGVRNESTAESERKTSQISICIAVVCIWLVIGVRTSFLYTLLSFVLSSMCICIWTIALLLFSQKKARIKTRQFVQCCAERIHLYDIHCKGFVHFRLLLLW